MPSKKRMPKYGTLEALFTGPTKAQKSDMARAEKVEHDFMKWLYAQSGVTKAQAQKKYESLRKAAGFAKKNPVYRFDYIEDLQAALRNELEKWAVKQAKNPLESFYLWYLPSTKTSYGGIEIAAKKPGDKWQLAAGERIHKGASIEQNFNHFRNTVLPRLPVMNIKDYPQYWPKKNPVYSNMYKKGYENAAINFAYIPDFKNTQEKKDFERGLRDGYEAIKKKTKKNPCGTRKNALLDYHTEWLNHDGKVVTIDGYKHKIRVRTHKAIYPYEHTAIHVDAEPLNKNTKYYREEKRKLGDDWSIDVLSSPELSAEVLAQLEKKNNPCGKRKNQGSAQTIFDRMEARKREGKRKADANKPYFRAQIAKLDRYQSSDNLRRMIKALEIHAWQNTVDEWQRYYEAKNILAIRRERKRK